MSILILVQKVYRATGFTKLNGNCGLPDFLRITRFVILVMRPDCQKFCLRSTPALRYGICSYFHYSNHILLCIFSNRLYLSSLILTVVCRYLPKSIQSFGMNLNEVYPYYYHYNTCDSVIRIKRCFYDSDSHVALTRLFSGGFGDGVLPAQTAQV